MTKNRTLRWVGLLLWVCAMGLVCGLEPVRAPEKSQPGEKLQLDDPKIRDMYYRRFEVLGMIPLELFELYKDRNPREVAQEVLKRWWREEERLVRMSLELEQLQRQGKISKEEMQRRVTAEWTQAWLTKLVYPISVSMLHPSDDRLAAHRDLLEVYLAAKVSERPSDVYFTPLQMAVMVGPGLRVSEAELVAAHFLLLDHPDEKIAHEAKEFVKVRSSRHGSLSNIDAVREADSRYLHWIRRKGKLPSEKYVDMRFENDPHHMLVVLCEVYRPILVNGEPNREPDRLEDLARNLKIYLWRNETPLWKQEIELARKELQWLWRTYPDWWARRYVVEMIDQDLRLAYEGFVEDLVKEKHPYVAKRGKELLKWLRKTP